MGLITKLFGRKHAAPVPEPPSSQPICPHTSCAPQWDSAADMGQEARASRFVCGACGETFTPAEFEALRATEADRVRQLVATTPSQGGAPD